MYNIWKEKMDASINLNSNQIQKNYAKQESVETAGSIAQANTQSLFANQSSSTSTASSDSSSSGGNFSAMA